VALPLALYVMLAVATIGRHALPHLGSSCACNGTADPASYMWALSWWPHALLHGLNPFVTHELWAPTGGNVAQAAMIPTAAIVMAPFTLLAGPIASYNVLAIASPALSAFTAFLLCRRLIKRDVAALAGGYVYGFGSYEFARLMGNINLALVFLLPLFVLVAEMRAHQEITRRRYVIAMAVLLLAQAGLSTELLADSVALGLLALVCVRVMLPGRCRRDVDRILFETIGAGVLALIAGAPFFYYAVVKSGPGTISSAFPNVLGLDLLNPVIPTQLNALGGGTFSGLSAKFSGHYVAEADGYLGLPLIVAFVAYMIGSWRTSLLPKVLAVVSGVAFVLALGAHLYVAGHQTAPLPFDAISALPVLDNLTPNRFIVFVTLCAAIGTAGLAASARGRPTVRLAVVLLALIVPLPNLTSELYGRPPRNPPLFTTSAYRTAIAKGSTVLALPYGFEDASMLWQAQAGFWFKLAEGYLRASTPAPFDVDPAVSKMLVNTVPPAALFLAFLRRHAVRVIVVDRGDVGADLPYGGPDTSPWPSYLARLGFRGRDQGGVRLYSVP
jgi:hypothetical protein